MGAQGALVVPPPPMVHMQIIPVDLEPWVVASLNSCRARLGTEAVRLAAKNAPLTVHKALEATLDVVRAQAAGDGSWVHGLLQRSVEVLDGLVYEDLDVRMPNVVEMMGEQTGRTCFTCCLRRFSSSCDY